MKKIVTIILITSVCFLTAVSTINTISVRADSSYLRVITEDTPFYCNPLDESPAFYLPYTYYVKVLNHEGDFTHVECYGNGTSIAIDGYVPTEMLYDDDLPVSNPFVNINLTTTTTSVLYSDSKMTTPVQYVFSNRNLRFYGTYECSGSIIYYVEYNGKLGYINESDVYPFAIANHPNELTFIEVDAPSEPVPDENPSETPDLDPDKEPLTEDFFSLKVIIVLCLLFAGIVALFIALKQKPQKAKSSGYYDENDYE